MTIFHRKYTSRALLCLILAASWTPFRSYSQDSDLFYDPRSEKDEAASKEAAFQVTIDPRHRTSLSAEIVSSITKINKKMGESFHEGEILIELNEVIYVSHLKKAEAALEKARVEWEAKRQLFKDNVASLFELKEAQSNVATAEADLSLAKKNMLSTKIIAPYDGKVVSIDVQEYETPQLGKSLIEIVDDRVLIAKFLIPSTLLKKISPGTKFNILVHETGENVPAEISRIGSIIDPSSGTVKIEADIENDKSDLKTGMTGKALFDFTEP